MRVTYNPLVFEQPTEAAAKAIIVTPEGGLSTEHRWEHETPYVAGLIGEQLALQPGELVLDYGCGIGRIARALIERFDVRILGVDISQAMRGLAPAYVASPNFSVVSGEMLRRLVEAGLKADAAIAVWVLQHCVRPQEDIALIREALRGGGRLFVLNNCQRVVPTLEIGWADDYLDIKRLVNEAFSLNDQGQPSSSIGESLASKTFWMCSHKIGAR